MADTAKVSKSDNFKKRVSKFFREIRSELKKVIWPSRTQVVNNTVTVLATCLLVGIIIWLADSALREAVSAVLSR